MRVLLMIQCNECNQHPCICNQTVPENPVNLFGSPFDCKKQIRTRRFASLNSPLPRDEFENLQACIDAVNDLLRSLGNERDTENTRQLQLHFLDLKGVVVKASILCGFELLDDDLEIDEEMIVHEENSKPLNVNLNELEEKIVGNRGKTKVKGNRRKDNAEDIGEQNNNCTYLIYKSGKLATAGRDFIQINPIGSAMFILYKNLLSISRLNFPVEDREPKFINADQETRRELALNFGEFVSKNTDIENQFFGIPMYKAVKKYIGKEVTIRTDEEFLKGTLINAREGSVQIQNKKIKKQIDIQSICFLQVFNLK